MTVQNHTEIRAVYDETTIRVYQAYGDDIADAALANGTFVSPPFSMTRMTWVKPSFLWMMYRAGWGLKDKGQNRILAIDLSLEGFGWALSHSCSSHRDLTLSKEEWSRFKAQHPVRIQWDPERDLQLQPLPYRSLQMGLEGEAVTRYVRDWIMRIEDVTPLAHRIHKLVTRSELEEAQTLLPKERVFPRDKLPVT